MQFQNSYFSGESPRVQYPTFQSYVKGEDESDFDQVEAYSDEIKEEVIKEENDTLMGDVAPYSNWELLSILKDQTDASDTEEALSHLFTCCPNSDSITLKQVPYTLYKKLENATGYDLNFVSSYFQADMPQEHLVGLCVINKSNDIPPEDAVHYSNWELVSILKDQAAISVPEEALSHLFTCCPGFDSITLNHMPYTLFKKLEKAPGYDLNFVSSYFSQDMPEDQVVGLCVINKSNDIRKEDAVHYSNWELVGNFNNQTEVSEPKDVLPDFFTIYGEFKI
ncbi:hypothetical protein [Criblamydia sequanensis]|nr:hypothetical protein [Criblamydia sequanensis]